MWIWTSMMLAALSLCLLFWWIGRPFMQAAVAAQNLVQAPLRLLWPWVDALAPVCLPLMSWRLRQRLERLLHQAGTGAPWSPQHLCAFQVTMATVSIVSIVLATYRSLSPFAMMVCSIGAALLAAILPLQRLRERVQRRRLAMSREFPFLLDMVTLCVEAGLNLHGALQQAAKYGPAGPLRQELHHMLSDIRAGTSRSDAFEQWSSRCELPAVQYFVAAIAQAEQSGMSLGPVLRAQSEQRRNERFLRAEKLALEAPVKMMFPLIFCIFPCTFLIIGFPIATKFLALAE